MTGMFRYSGRLVLTEDALVWHLSRQHSHWRSLCDVVTYRPAGRRAKNDRLCRRCRKAFDVEQAGGAA